MKIIVRCYVVFMVILVLANPGFGGEYDFEAPRSETKTWEFGGNLELLYIHHQFGLDSSAYHLKYPEADKDAMGEWRPSGEFTAGYNFGNAQFKWKTHHEYQTTGWDEEWNHKVYEGYLALRPTPNLTVDIGKKSYLWGKGYAWNPAGFINRSKDPDNPEASLEGYTALSVDYIKSLSGQALRTVAVTPVILPVFSWENSEMGEQGDVNYALKLYLLLYDADIDLIYFGGPNQPARYGLDFSRNLKENLELHGELAYRSEAWKNLIEADGNVVRIREDEWSWLVGLRYLDQHDTTYIFEYYHNGAGYTPDEIETFFQFQESAYRKYQTAGNTSPLKDAASKAGFYYSQRNYGRDYLYLKASSKEPFDILYFTPSVAATFNLGDGSFSLTPGLTYQITTNVEVELKTVLSFGPKGTEFGEKQDEFRTEALLRLYF